MAKKQKNMTAEQLPLVAIDLGSNGIRAMAAERIDDSTLRVLGVEYNNKFSCVDRSVIANTSEAGYMIVESLRLLANRAKVKDLPTAFVAVGGRSVQIHAVKAWRDQARAKLISQSLLEELETECKTKIEEHNKGVSVIGLIPSYYVLDGVEQDYAPTPIQRATIVEAHYFAFVGMEELETKLFKSFDQAGKSIEHTFVRPEALLSAFAQEDGIEVLQDGCAVLDLGAQTTTLTAFKGTQYLLHKVVAQGGYHLTRVVEQQGIPWETAERLKCEYGYASADQVEKNLRMRIKATPAVGGEVVISSEELAYNLSLKLEEIINPLMDALRPLESRLKTLYITGGASMLRGIDQYIQQKTKLQVLYGAHDQLLSSDTPEQYCEPQYSSLVGTLLLGADYRQAHKGEEVKKPSFLTKLQIETLSIFGGEQNNE